MSASEPSLQSEKILKLLKLIEDTGTSIEQKNGQRRYGPRPGAPKPPRGSEVFVARIPRDCFEDEIIPVFSKYDPIYEMRLLMDFSGSNRGYAFIRYDSADAAQRAIDHLEGYEIRPGRRVGVVISLDNSRLYVGGLPRKLTRDELWQEVSCRVQGVTDLDMYSDIHDRSLNRGYAFIQFETHGLASLARRRLVGQLSIRGHQTVVEWAEPEHSVSPHVLKKVRVLHVRNMLMKTSETALKSTVETAIGLAVHRVKKINNYAFVHFNDRNTAELAFERLQTAEVDGQKLEVSWARPVADRVQYRADKNSRDKTKSPESLAHKYNMWLYNWQVLDQAAVEKASSRYCGDPAPPSAAALPTSAAPPAPHAAPTTDYALAPCRLEAICARYKWDTPVYSYVQLADGMSWVGTVRLPCVFHPQTPHNKQELCTGYTAPCSSVPEAYVAAARGAIELLKVFRDHPYQMWSPIPLVSSPYITPPLAGATRWAY